MGHLSNRTYRATFLILQAGIWYSVTNYLGMKFLYLILSVEQYRPASIL
jgi:hypothetical protein